MRDMRNIVGTGDVDELRSQREARLNPPQYESGQGDDSDWSFFDDSQSSMDDSSFRGSDPMSDFSFNSSDIGALGGSSMSKDQMAKNMTSQEDKIIDAFVNVCKFIYVWSKELVMGVKDGFSDSNPFFWAVYGKRLLNTGIAISIVGLVFSLLGLFSGYFSGGFWVIIGGLLCMMTGIVIFVFNHEKKEDPDIVDDSEVNIDNSNSDTSSEDSWYSFDDDDDGSDNEEEVEEAEDDFSMWNFDDISLDEDEVSDDTVVSGVYDEDINIDSAIENIREIPPHTQTRQYLYEEYSKVLPLINPEFSELKSISENSDNFIIFDKILRDASLQVGTREDKLPELLELRENQFIIQLKATRQSGLKEDDIANEIANIYSKDEFGGVLHEGVYATTSSVGSNFIINIFKGEDSLVSLADTYREEKDFVLDPNVKKPIILGVNELGRVWKCDAEKIYSYIFSGKPRTGKSWGVVSLVVQLCMYSSPREVVFEALDVKDTSSDFYKMNKFLPHFKNFEGNPQRIMNRLRHLTTVEADRRKKILKDNDVINIADLKKKGVDIDIPYHYVIVDEMLGLKGQLSKEENDEFKSLINTIVTQMPNLGFRVILVPHRVTNDVIPKTTYTLVGCIACVKSDFKEINTTLEVNKKEFPYSLPNVGDMALKTSEINRGNTVFCHGIAITSSNDRNEDVYKFIGSLWGMLDPDNKSTSQVSADKKEEYKGHNLEGVDSILNDSDFLGSDDNLEEDFWKDVLGEE